MLKAAQAGKYAVGLFDVHTMEGVHAVLEAAAELKSPVIMAPMGGNRRAYVAWIRELAERVPVPVAIELDHGRDFANVIDAIRAGYTDVMLDVSTRPYEENVAMTQKVSEAAHLAGCGVEGEIGHVGSGMDYDKTDELQAGYTRPEEAVQFVAATKVDLLAIAIGSAHGVYKGDPKLDYDRLVAIRKAVDTPLVLHGGSGIPDDDFRKAVSLGICKINIYTAMALAAIDCMHEKLSSPTVRYTDVGRAVQGAIKDVVMHHMKVFGSDGKA
jgi:fructose-bisphosphate aldolase class II